VTLLRRQGLVNNALIGMGAIDEPLALMWNEIGVTIGMVHYMLPLGILPLWAAMRDIDGRVLAASRGLGASATQTFVRVFLPLSLPGVIGAGLLVFIFSLGFFITPAILGGQDHHGRRIHQLQVQVAALGCRHHDRHHLVATIFALMFALSHWSICAVVRAK
jgi:putative spermidine/putrescine transport system permease protein